MVRLVAIAGGLIVAMLFAEPAFAGKGDPNFGTGPDGKRHRDIGKFLRSHGRPHGPGHGPRQGQKPGRKKGKQKHQPPL